MYRTSATVSLFVLFLTYWTHSHAAVTTSPNPITYWNTNTIIQACPNIQNNRICDPDHILTTNTNTHTNTLQITSAIHELESNHPLTCHTNNTTSNTQMAIVIVNHIHMNGNNHHDDQYKIQAAKHFAMTLHDTWGVGNTSCGGSGLLLFLSIKDHVLYLSTSPGIMHILTSSRINTIIEDMKDDLREEEYNLAILEAIQKIQYYLDMGPPSFFERNGGWMIMSAILSLFVGCSWWKERNKREYVKVHLQLKKLDQAKALSLMGKYQCNSCPICFHEFQEITNVDWIDKNNDAEIDLKDKSSPPSSPSSPSSNGFRGCDKQPIQLLQCGHAFCKTCFQDWIKSGSRIIHQCPVCKQDIGQSSCSSRIDSSTHLSLDPRSRGPVEIQPLVIPLQNDLYHHPPSSGSSHSHYYSRNDEYGRYRSERNFRIHRLHHRYPRFVNQDMLQRWTTNDYDGNLADDQIFVNMRPTEPSSSTQQHYSGNHDGQSSFSSFGGGSSGGGGGGTW